MIICKQISPANYFVLKFISFEIKATLRCNIFQTTKKLHGCRHFISFKQQKEKKTSVTGKLRSTKYSLPYAVENSDVKVSHDLVLWVCFSFFMAFQGPKPSIYVHCFSPWMKLKYYEEQNFLRFQRKVCDYTRSKDKSTTKPPLTHTRLYQDFREYMPIGEDNGWCWWDGCAWILPRKDIVIFLRRRLTTKKRPAWFNLLRFVVIVIDMAKK